MNPYDKERGLYKKYEVTKVSNPKKKLDCVVLEFDDPIGRVGIAAWAEEMRRQGFAAVADDCEDKIEMYEGLESKMVNP